MTCTDVEILLCDFADGTLAPSDRAAVSAHLDVCPACSELARDAAAAMAFLAGVADVEPPPELITRILHATPQAAPVRPPVPEDAGALAKAASWWSGLFRPMLQPRLTMGLAMTILSFSMVARFAGVPGKPLTANEMRPAYVWETFDAKLGRIHDRAVKYYENLKLVYQIQSRLAEWSAQEEEERKSQSGGQILESPAEQTDRSKQ